MSSPDRCVYTCTIMCSQTSVTNFVFCFLCCINIHFSVLILLPVLIKLHVNLFRYLHSSIITSQHIQIYTYTHSSAASKLHPTLPPYCFHSRMHRVTFLSLSDDLRLIFLEIPHRILRFHWDYYSLSATLVRTTVIPIVIIR